MLRFDWSRMRDSTRDVIEVLEAVRRARQAAAGPPELGELEANFRRKLQIHLQLLQSLIDGAKSHDSPKPLGLDVVQAVSLAMNLSSVGVVITKYPAATQPWDLEKLLVEQLWKFFPWANALAATQLN